LAVAEDFLNFDPTRQLAKGGFGKFDSGNDEGLARAHDGTGGQGGRDGRQGGGVAAADVLGKSGLDGSADFCGGQFHVETLGGNSSWEKEKAGGWHRGHHGRATFFGLNRPDFGLICGWSFDFDLH
jgi:hypothetical protein